MAEATGEPRAPQRHAAPQAPHAVRPVAGAHGAAHAGGLRQAKPSRPAVSRARFCHVCGQLLGGSYYRAGDGRVFCSTCYTTRPRCARCDTPLDGAEASASAGSAPLCRRCGATTPKCSACERPILGIYYTFEELLPADQMRRFCEQCVQRYPPCDLCRAPSGPGSRTLDDGQYRCALCASQLVTNDAEVRALYADALRAFRQIIGAAPREIPRLEVVSRRRMGEARRAYDRHAATQEPAAVSAGGHTTASDHHVLGYFVRDGNGSVILIERALPRALLLGTLAHELGHAWQAERAPSIRDPLLCEGFAEWVAHHVLVVSGERALAARSTRRDDLYGQGLRRYLGVERATGRDAALALACGQ